MTEPLCRGRGTCRKPCPYYGLCHCRCGAETPICNNNHGRKAGNYQRGNPLVYVAGHHNRPARWPIEELMPYLQAFVDHHPREAFSAGIVAHLAEAWAHRYKIKVASAKRLLERVLHQWYLNDEQADMLACLIGLNPVLIWTNWHDWIVPVPEQNTRKAGRYTLPVLGQEFRLDEPRPFACETCSYRGPSDHALYLHALSKHGDRTQGRHTWRTQPAVVG